MFTFVLTSFFLMQLLLPKYNFSSPSLPYSFVVTFLYLGRKQKLIISFLFAGWWELIIKDFSRYCSLPHSKIILFQPSFCHVRVTTLKFLSHVSAIWPLWSTEGEEVTSKAHWIYNKTILLCGGDKYFGAAFKTFIGTNHYVHLIF